MAEGLMRGGGLREGDEGSVKALELHEGCRVSVRDGRLSSGEGGGGQVL